MLPIRRELQQRDGWCGLGIRRATVFLSVEHDDHLMSFECGVGVTLSIATECNWALTSHRLLLDQSCLVVDSLELGHDEQHLIERLALYSINGHSPTAFHRVSGREAHAF